MTCAPLRVWWHRRCEGAGGSCGGAPWGCCALGEQPGAMGRAEGSDFEVGWSRHCQGWVLPCPPGIPALQVLPSLAGCAVSGGLRGWGRLLRWESCGLAFPGQCPGLALALSRLAVTLCWVWGRLVPSPMLWNLLVKALGPLLGFFVFPHFWHHLSLLCSWSCSFGATSASAENVPGP